jgi:uncharacterized cupredoxin-like copper-binding protein
VFALSARSVKADETIDWSRSTPVTITLTSYQFAPAQIGLQHGKAYRLHLVNTSGKGHNFSAPGLFSSSTIAPADRTKIEDGAVEVDSGSSVDVSLVPMMSGDYAVRCTHFLHSTFGMHGAVTVN